MRIKKLIIGLIVGASLIAGQATVGAYNGNTAASPDPQTCTQINTTPGKLSSAFRPGIGNPLFGTSPYITCTATFFYPR